MMPFRIRVYRVYEGGCGGICLVLNALRITELGCASLSQLKSFKPIYLLPNTPRRSHYYGWVATTIHSPSTTS